jgi:glycerophosphoryl diester phosphodiesterase
VSHCLDVLLQRLLSLSTINVIAHRGGSKIRPENTLTAFDHAASLGVDAFECDVHLSRDGEVVVIHDPTLDRTTDATGPVSARTAAELEHIDAAYRFGEADGFPLRGKGVGVPRLTDVLLRFPTMPVIVEIKGENPDVAAPVVDVIRQAGADKRVIIGGFSRVVLDAVRQIAPGLPTGASSPEARWALHRAYLGLSPRRPSFQTFQVPFRLRGRQMFGSGFVRAARRGHVPVFAWIVDEPEVMRMLIDWGVTGLISDRPDLGLDVARRSPGVSASDL